jgi:outer membrane beta-barrel protein
VTNELTDAAIRYQKDNQRVPDLAYVKYRLDFLGGFHTFYGKFRVSMDQVFYFDHYIALGPGMLELQNGRQYAAVADTGFIFWFGKQFTARLGLKDYYFHEVRLIIQGNTNHLLGHFDIGFIFGA